MVRGDNDDDEYAPNQPESEAAAASYDLEPEIPFAFGGKRPWRVRSDKTSPRSPYSPGVISLSSSLSTGAGTNGDTAALGEAIYFLGEKY